MQNPDYPITEINYTTCDMFKKTRNVLKTSRKNQKKKKHGVLFESSQASTLRKFLVGQLDGQNSQVVRQLCIYVTLQHLKKFLKPV